MKRRTISALVSACVALFALALSSPQASAQEVARARQVRPQSGAEVVRAGTSQSTTADRAVEVDADQTRREFYELLDKYPPTLGRVLRLDSTLMMSETYLTSYPLLASFLGQHPEIARNPGYFLERYAERNAMSYNVDERTARRRDIAGILGGVAAFFVFLVVTGVIVWVVRTIIDHRRWNRVSKTQFDVHSKLLERFTTNDELLAYVQTPVGRRFLESGPAPLPGDPQPVGAPYSRILWSVQAGVILIATGAGLAFLNWRVDPDFAPFFLVSGVIALAIGGGSIVSGAAAYVLSRRLGLLNRTDVDHA